MIGKEVLRELKKNKLRIEEEKTTFKEKVRISHKMNSEVRNFCIPVVLQYREHVFLENGHKGNFTQGSHSCAFSH